MERERIVAGPMNNVITVLLSIVVAVVFFRLLSYVWKRIGGNLLLPDHLYRWEHCLYSNSKEEPFKTILLQNVGTSVAGDNIVQQCSLINHALVASLTARDLLKAQFKANRLIVVHLMGDMMFNIRLRRKLQETNLQYLKREDNSISIATADTFLEKVETRLWGKPVTMVCIRLSCVPSLMNTGEPLIHALLHAYQGNFFPLSTHANPAIWKEAGGDHSVQATVQAKVVGLRLR
jgi:hypothetical protein